MSSVESMILAHDESTAMNVGDEGKIVRRALELDGLSTWG